MSAIRSPSRNRVEHEASAWAVRLDVGALTPADQAEFEGWLAADPEHRWVLSRYRELSAQLSAQVPVLMEAEAVEEVFNRATARQRWQRRLAPMLAVAAALTVAAVAWWWLPQKVETRSFERRTLTLADGSRVELNAQTNLAINLGRRERHVKFVRGEALFQVAHDAARPFFVDTPKGAVRVTGTVFNVRETATANVEVTVLEGTVQVRSAEGMAQPLSLAVGNQAALTGRKVSVSLLSTDETQNAVAWRVGQAAFQDAPLAEALARFAPYYVGRITISPEAGAINVGGRYSLDDLDGFLAAIEQALPVAVLRGPDGAVRVVARTPQPR